MVKVGAFFYVGKRFVCVHTTFYDRCVVYFVRRIEDSMLDALEILHHGTGDL